MINYNGTVRYTEDELCEEILQRMSIPSDGVGNINKNMLFEYVVPDCTESELKPYGSEGYVQMYIQMLWTMIYRWFDSNKINFGSYYSVYIDDDDDDNDDDDDDINDDDLDKDSQKAMRLIEREDWDSLVDEVWEDFCNRNFKKYGIDANDYKMSETEEEE